MNWLRAQLTRTPLVARVVPFVFFVVLTFTQEWFGTAARYWIYLPKTVLGAAMLHAGRASAGGSVLPLVRLPLHLEGGFSQRAAWGIRRAAFSHHLTALRR